MHRLPVMESFLTIQGEGFYTGHLAYFIRLAGCDVGCTWCDVKESWSVSDEQYIDIKDIILELSKHKVKKVVITGGEPLMYDLHELTNALHEKSYEVHLETSGAHSLRGSFDWICLSPKKFSHPLPEIYQMADELKVIVVNNHDFEWADKEAQKVKQECLLYLQAEWIKKDKQNAAIYSYIVDHPKWKISVQTHKYLGLP